MCIFFVCLKIFECLSLFGCILKFKMFENNNIVWGGSVISLLFKDMLFFWLLINFLVSMVC